MTPSKPAQELPGRTIRSVSTEHDGGVGWGGDRSSGHDQQPCDSPPPQYKSIRLFAPAAVVVITPIVLSASSQHKLPAATPGRETESSGWCQECRPHGSTRSAKGRRHSLRRHSVEHFVALLKTLKRDLRDSPGPALWYKAERFKTHLGHTNRGEIGVNFIFGIVPEGSFGNSTNVEAKINQLARRFTADGCVHGLVALGDWWVFGKGQTVETLLSGGEAAIF
eukprot:2837660-Rhodomonas_salina.4